MAAFYHIATCTAPPEIPASISAQTSDFIRTCMQLSPDARPTCTALLHQNEWMLGYCPGTPLDASAPAMPMTTPTWHRRNTTTTLPGWGRRFSLPSHLRRLSYSSAVSPPVLSPTAHAISPSARQVLEDQRRFLRQLSETYNGSMRSLKGRRVSLLEGPPTPSAAALDPWRGRQPTVLSLTSLPGSPLLPSSPLLPAAPAHLERWHGQCRSPGGGWRARPQPLSLTYSTEEAPQTGLQPPTTAAVPGGPVPRVHEMTDPQPEPSTADCEGRAVPGTSQG